MKRVAPFILTVLMCVGAHAQPPLISENIGPDVWWGQFSDPQSEFDDSAVVARVRIIQEEPITCGYLYRGQVTELFKGDEKSSFVFFSFRHLAPVAKERDFLVFAYRSGARALKGATQLKTCRPPVSLYLGYQFDSFVPIEKAAGGREIVRPDRDIRRVKYGLRPCLRDGQSSRNMFDARTWDSWRKDIKDIAGKKAACG